ncbi:exodeoxyribonuclease VII small subunit [Streptomyces megasporus]|uniref:exodeoxyribonuclease VII small subunit n=1 Tax=Streptomyces megasporus TaxID=44060 RepID=UPI0004E142E3|nr:exodeoxyribonuclease VII small subunit [Streptomyces megasporus]
MTDVSTPPPIGEMGYEQARDELIAVVRRLEAGGSTLEESLALWERGEELAAVCRRLLDGARARLDAVLAEESGAEDGEPDDEGDGEEESAEDDGLGERDEEGRA